MRLADLCAEDDDEEEGEIPSFVCGLSCMFITLMFFESVNRLLDKGSKYHRRFNEKEFWKYKNYVTSWVHSFITSVLSLLCLLLYLPEMLDDSVDYQNKLLYSLISFTTGYFIFDYLDTMRNDKSQVGVMVHHVCVVGNFLYNILVGRCLPIAVMALTIEINTVFLHTRKLLQMWHVRRDDPFYRTICWINLLTFALFRGGALALVGYSFYQHGHKLHFLYRLWVWPTWFSMSLINLILFWRVFTNDVINYFKKRGPAPSKYFEQGCFSLFFGLQTDAFKIPGWPKCVVSESGCVTIVSGQTCYKLVS